MKTLFLLILSMLLWVVVAWGQIDMTAIATIESSNGTDRSAYSIHRHSIGMYQVSRPVLREYNDAHRSHYTVDMLLSDEINRRVATWYIEERIPEMLKAYRAPVRDDLVIISYNAGIRSALDFYFGNKKPPKETINYLSKYKKMQGGEK